MKLKSYLAENNMTFREFAELIDVNATYLASISRGILKPSRRLAAEIEKITDGIVKITPSDKVKKRKLSRKVKIVRGWVASGALNLADLQWLMNDKGA